MAPTEIKSMRTRTKGGWESVLVTNRQSDAIEDDTVAVTSISSKHIEYQHAIKCLYADTISAATAFDFMKSDTTH